MTPRTLRRKLQKKLKHKPYRKCPACGERAYAKLVDDRCHRFCNPRLFAVCGQSQEGIECNSLKATGGTGCGWFCELFWSGGGIGRHIPDSGNAGMGKA